ncbi:hypothetical protein HMPREF0791_0477 [Staphylococcus epidermidis W23144]|nr:hypothetical protein HMPREF0791_0477 [Staphylococcus epidermidis W23144]OFR23201.1 hypothetical protein HMPREF2900_07220 [Staphylococcus sp. HMSC065D11]
MNNNIYQMLENPMSWIKIYYEKIHGFVHKFFNLPSINYSDLDFKSLLIELITFVLTLIIMFLIPYIFLFVVGFTLDVLLKKHYSKKNFYKKNDVWVNKSNNVEHIKRYYFIWQRNRLKELRKYSIQKANNDRSIFEWSFFPFVKNIKTYINK